MMLALSIKPFWAHAILNLNKDIENRDWSTEYRGRIALHTSIKYSQKDWDNFIHFLGRKEIPVVSESELICGAIIGSVELVDCLSFSDSPWFRGKFGFVLKNPIRLIEPLFIVGSPGLWELPFKI